MTGKQKLVQALDHNGGPVPVDFGSTATTGMHVSVVEALRKHYGLEDRPVKVNEPYQMLGEVEPDLREAMGADVVGVHPRGTFFGFPLGDWKEWQTPWGQNVLVPGDFNVTMDGNDVLIYPEGDMSVPPSGRMPEGGFFFDSIIRQEPIDDDNLDPEDNCEEFGPISQEELDHLAKETAKAREIGCGVIANFGGTGFGDIALVPGPFLKYPKGIRDVAEWYMSTAMRKDYVHAVFSKQLEYVLENLPKIKDAVGDGIDAVFLCGTDFGTQEGQFCSPDTFRELWLPYYRQMTDWIHANTDWKCFKHCCGSIVPLLDCFIEAGFDIMNPIQCSAAGMKPEMLKSQYGDKLTFWGGGVDTQHTLPFGSPDEVRSQVRNRCEVFAQDGGFVFNAIHNVQAKCPIENIVAMLETVREFNNKLARS